MGRRPPTLTALEAEFEAHLKARGKAANTIKYHRSYIQRFLKHIGNQPLNRSRYDHHQAIPRERMDQMLEDECNSFLRGFVDVWVDNRRALLAV
jgi:hypothetical protein